MYLGMGQIPGESLSPSEQAQLICANGANPSPLGFCADGSRPGPNPDIPWITSVSLGPLPVTPPAPIANPIPATPATASATTAAAFSLSGADALVLVALAVGAFLLLNGGN